MPFFEDGEFEGKPVRVAKANYLAFLSLKGSEIDIEVRRMREMFNAYSSKEIETDLILLLKAANWRVHNIACVFISVGFYTEEVAEALWERITLGSWVSPQLVATAAYVDQYFVSKSKSVIRNRATYFKSLVSLVHILCRNYKYKVWFGKVWLRVRAARKFDKDNSGQIAESWLESLRRSCV